MAKSRPRRGYEVLGTFTRLPDLVERPICASCTLQPIPAGSRKRVSKAVLAEYLLPAPLQLALSLGRRVALFLSLLSSAAEQAMERAQRLHQELISALMAWANGLGTPPRTDRELLKHARSYQDVVALLSAFTEDGALIPEIAQRPKYQVRYLGSSVDILGQALFLYSTERALTLSGLLSFRRSLKGADSDLDMLRATLIAGRWMQDGDDWLPEQEYLSGSLWGRYDRAKARANQGDPVAAAQAARLLETIAPVTLSAVEPDPRLPWIPLEVIRGFLSQITGQEVEPLERRYHYLVPTSKGLTDLLKPDFPKPLAVALGFLNHDPSLFRLEVVKQVDTETGGEESETDAQTRAREDYENKALASFASYLRDHRSIAELVVDAYNRTYRGYIEPTYNSGFVDAARWGGRIKLRAHQQAGASRLLAHNGGLLAFDVGVGKTLTGIATIARLREEGRARRPVIILPNTLLFQWLKQIKIALPDYRVLVIGAERYIGRNGTLVSRTDTAEERALKWRQFQAGGADLVLVSYTMFARVAVRPESRMRFAMTSPPMLRMMGLQMRSSLGQAESEDKPKRKAAKATKAAVERMLGAKTKTMTEEELLAVAEQLGVESERQRENERRRLKVLIENLSSMSERERAILQDKVARWATSFDQAETDPGIFWEDLGIDCLMLDEAQNMKNLWPTPRGAEEKPPKYLGAIAEPSSRALEFAIRASMVRQKSAGSGVFLLSATPAKNSPLEYFSLLSLVDGEAWGRVGITDPSVFMDRYLRIEVKRTMGTGLETEFRSVVVGFKNIPELRDLIFRLAEFRTAEEVGLKLPKTEPKTISVPMSVEQIEKHGVLLEQYRALIKSFSKASQMEALGVLMKLGMLSLHPELPFGPRNKEGKPQWTSTNWNQVRSHSSAKLESAVAEALKKRRCGHIFFCEPVGVHYWLRELLVEKGVPRERIAILNADQAPTPLRRQVIAEKFNGTPPVLDESGNIEQEGEAPEYDIIIANSVAYEGIDLHIRTCLVHHLDLPWEPATLQQRNGRAVRQGNTQAVIGIYYYVSQGSIDLVRLAIILGKLGWMKDILQSAERETNNPAAGSDMDSDELVQFLYKPEEIGRIRAELQQKKESDDRRSARKRAWGIVRRLQEMTALDRSKSAIEIGQGEHASRELIRQLDEIPVLSWPWRRVLVPHVLAEEGLQLLELRYRPLSPQDPKDAESAREDLIVTAPLWEGSHFTDTEEENRVQFEVGEVDAEHVNLRRFGTISWLRISAGLLNSSAAAVHVALYRALRHASPEQYEERLWDKLLDKEGRESRLREALSKVADKGLGAMEMRYAPEWWRDMLWTEWGNQILGRLGTMLVPLDEGRLSVVSASQLGVRKDNVISWTGQSFERFTRLAQESTYKWSELNDLSDSWFHRPFPKGILKGTRGDGISTVTLSTAKGPVKVSAPWVEAGLAVTQSLEDAGPSKGQWKVSHTQSGLGIPVSFPTVALAQKFGEWLITFGVDWTRPITKLPDGMSGEDLDSVGKWMNQQALTPSVAQITEYDKQRRR